MPTIKNIRNSFDFYLRSRIKISRPLPENYSTPPEDLQLQNEFEEFLSLINWSSISLPNRLEVADIGARNFVFAPVIDRFLRKLNYDPTINGIEIDAHRLLAGFHSRKDYGNFYAKQIPQGEYLAMDFLDWERPFDLAFLLNPFFSKEPLVNWGLPLSKFQPAEIFVHCKTLLKPKGGLLVLSSPTAEELTSAKALADSAGFQLKQEVKWVPKDSGIQKQLRLGASLALR